MSVSAASLDLDINSVFDETSPSEDQEHLHLSKKRKRSNGQSIGDDEEEEEEDGPTNSSPVITQNAMEKVKRYAEGKKLKIEQKAEVEIFL